MEELRRVHFDPVYLPHHLKKNQRVYVAVLDDELPAISAVMVEEYIDYIYYRYSGNDPVYRFYQGNSYLLWWIAECYKLKGYKYFDLGGSAIPGIEKFKRGFSTSSYPLEKKNKLFKKIAYHVKRFLDNFEVVA